MPLRKTNKHNFGFTLVELLVVMAIIGILAVISLSNFRTSQQKARDAQRKHDLRQIASALEVYFNDFGSYPLSDASGNIVACNAVCSNTTVASCPWGRDPREMCRNNVSYMIIVPDDVQDDPLASGGQPPYCYEADASGKSYHLYAKLENSKDIDCLNKTGDECDPQVYCNSTEYDFGIASSNARPDDTSY